MKKYLAVFLGSEMGASGKKWMALEPAKRKELEAKGGQAWHAWIKAHEKSIVEMGSPLGKTKKVDANGITDTRNNLTGWTVVLAESQDAAAKMFLEHPHFSIFPGDSIEIMECMPIPGM
jgi:hypothetical protein